MHAPLDIHRHHRHAHQCRCLFAGHVGIPLVCNYIKLIDVEEMDYYAKDNVGEVSTVVTEYQPIL